MKKYKFLLFILLLAFLFIPKDVFAADIDSNTITPNSYEFYFESMNLNNELEIKRFDANRLQLYKWGTSTANYKLIRLAPLVRFNSLGVDTSYKARVVFYIFTKYPYSYEDKFCSLWSANGEKYSCTLHREMEDQIGSNEVLLTLVYDYEWTSSTGYVEFWLNFKNFTGTPNDTEFMFDILDFQGNVSGNQIILDGLGQTNEKLDQVNDTIKESFEKCKKSNNLLNPKNMASSTTKNGLTFTNNGDGTFNISGTTNAATNLTIYSWDYINSIISENKYYGLYSDSNLNLSINFYNNNGIKILNQNNSPLFITLKSNYGLALYLNSGVTVDYKNIKLMLYQSDEKITTYEPYGDNGQICVNRIDETNEKLDELNQTLNDDNVTGATNTGNDFFDNFNDSDNGGISGIITAPLNAINAMLNGTCQPLSTTFKDKTISLQCGTDMWNKLSGIRDFLNLVLGGLLCYRICLKIFHIVQNLKNPDNDKVEVMNL